MPLHEHSAVLGQRGAPTCADLVVRVVFLLVLVMSSWMSMVSSPSVPVGESFEVALTMDDAPPLEAAHDALTGELPIETVAGCCPQQPEPVALGEYSEVVDTMQPLAALDGSFPLGGPRPPAAGDRTPPDAFLTPLLRPPSLA